MYCIHCGKELPDNSKFCNHCGGAQNKVTAVTNTPASDKNNRSQKPSAEGKKNKGFTTVIYILAVIVGLVIAIGVFGNDDLKENIKESRVPTTQTSTEAPVEISASELIKAYVDNEVKADTLYDDKILKITGYVNRISQTDNLIMDNEPIIYIGTGNDIEACVRCYISADQKNIVAELEQGDKITVKGNCSGLGSSYFDLKCVSVFSCEIVE